MKVNLIGFKEVDFTPKDGNPVKGTNLYVSYNDKTFVGLGVKKIWIDKDDFKDLVNVNLKEFVSAEIDVDVDLNGKVLSICGA